MQSKQNNLPKTIKRNTKPKQTWLKCNKSIQKSTEPKTQQLRVSNNRANSHNWFQTKKQPKKIQPNKPKKQNTKKRNTKQTKKKLTNKPLTNKKQVFSNKLKKSRKYQ